MRKSAKILLLIGVIALALAALPYLKFCGPHKEAEFQTYASYDELAEDFTDPVIEAFTQSEWAQQHSIKYGIAWGWGFWGEPIVTAVHVALDSTSESYSVGFWLDDSSTVCVHRNVINESETQDNSKFKNADELNIRADYEVDGITVQKIFLHDYYVELAREEVIRNPDNQESQERLSSAENSSINDEYWERVVVNNTAYYIFSRDEEAADSVATVLARLARDL